VNTNLAKAAAVGALGGLLFGFDTAVISGTTQALTGVYSLTPEQLGLTVSMALIGTVLGAMTAGIPGQKYGGRETLRVLAVCYVVSALGCAFAWNWYVLLAARFIGGIGIGGSSVLGPVYIAELAPAKLRGRLVGLSAFCWLICPTTSSPAWAWALTSGAGSWASPRCQRFFSWFCSLASRPARAGW